MTRPIDAQYGRQFLNIENLPDSGDYTVHRQPVAEPGFLHARIISAADLAGTGAATSVGQNTGTGAQENPTVAISGSVDDQTATDLTTPMSTTTEGESSDQPPQPPVQTIITPPTPHRHGQLAATEHTENSTTAPGQADRMSLAVPGPSNAITNMRRRGPPPPLDLSRLHVSPAATHGNAGRTAGVTMTSAAPNNPASNLHPRPPTRPVPSIPTSVPKSAKDELVGILVSTLMPLATAKSIANMMNVVVEVEEKLFTDLVQPSGHICHIEDVVLEVAALNLAGIFNRLEELRELVWNGNMVMEVQLVKLAGIKQSKKSRDLQSVCKEYVWQAKNVSWLRHNDVQVLNLFVDFFDETVFHKYLQIRHLDPDHAIRKLRPGMNTVCASCEKLIWAVETLGTTLGQVCEGILEAGILISEDQSVWQPWFRFEAWRFDVDRRPQAGSTGATAEIGTSNGEGEGGNAAAAAAGAEDDFELVQRLWRILALPVPMRGTALSRRGVRSRHHTI
ncbi:MAG: hypothetical protein M1817_001508 [Caeruleum heppii]|nr:MAG: hypothetical protein M1817_001508 [Caeruleum heppii]